MALYAQLLQKYPNAVTLYPLNQIYYILFRLQFGECQNTREKKKTKKRKEKLGLV